MQVFLKENFVPKFSTRIDNICERNFIISVSYLGYRRGVGKMLPENDGDGFWLIFYVR